MKAERGNFLLQALLSLTLVFAFIPFFARRLATRDMGAQMYTTAEPQFCPRPHHIGKAETVYPGISRADVKTTDRRFFA